MNNALHSRLESPTPAKCAAREPSICLICWLWKVNGVSDPTSPQAGDLFKVTV